jgi:hypothetical protein
MALDYSTPDIIKNNELVKGEFSLCEYSGIDLSHKEFSPTTPIEQGLDFITSHFESLSGPEQSLLKDLGSSILFIARKKHLPGSDNLTF